MYLLFHLCCRYEYTKLCSLILNDFGFFRLEPVNKLLATTQNCNMLRATQNNFQDPYYWILLFKEQIKIQNFSQKSLSTNSNHNHKIPHMGKGACALTKWTVVLMWAMRVWIQLAIFSDPISPSLPVSLLCVYPTKRQKGHKNKKGRRKGLWWHFTA